MTADHVPPAWRFLVDRTDLTRTRLEDLPDPAATALPEGHVRLRVDRFGLTANNITYAFTGDLLGYWRFFPAPEGWGIVPVWGFAEVIESRHAGIAEGRRLFGYLPMASHLVVEPGAISASGFHDMAAHRQGLPAVYNQLLFCDADPTYDAAFENEQALYRPLFFTAFLLADSLQENDFGGARRIVFSSASSKTAFGTACELMSHHPESTELVGLTSAHNVEFTRRLGCYDRVLPYEALPTLAPEIPTVFVDLAGNRSLFAAVHRHFEDHLQASIVVGVTHADPTAPESGLPGPSPIFFFAPTQFQKRHGEWGPEELQRRYGEAWRNFLRLSRKHLTIRESRAPEALATLYREVQAGQVRPEEAHALFVPSSEA